jgi:hypothetical protein
LARQPDTLSSDVAALAAQALHTFGRLRLRAYGSSMLPTIRPGDVLQFEVCTADPTRGDVVLFRSGSRLFVHRIVARTKNGFITQGDGLIRPDPLVDAPDVLGRMVGHYRRGKALSPRIPPALPVTSWLFGRFSLVARMFLHWRRTPIRASV